MAEITQETRCRTVSAALTPSEEWCVKLVHRKTGIPISDLMRMHSLDHLIAWGERIDRALDEVVEGKAAIA